MAADHSLTKAAENIELYGSGLAGALGGEDIALRAQQSRGRAMALLLDELTRIKSGNTETKRSIRKVLRAADIKIRNFSLEELRTANTKLTKILNIACAKRDAYRSRYERKFLAAFRRYAPNLPIYSGLWIGNHNVDAFVMAIRTNSGVGVAFEIDGGVHNEEKKGKKDESKDDFLFKLGIAPYHVTNEEVTDGYVKHIVDDWGDKRRTDAKSQAALWRRIYILTLAFGGQNLDVLTDAHQIICDLIGVGGDRLWELLKIINKKETKKFDFKNEEGGRNVVIL